MSAGRAVVAAAAVALVPALPLAVGCSKKSNPTTPVGGGAPPELDSGDMPAGRVYTHTFANAGSFPYHCVYHGSMKASVTVAGGGADSAFVSIAGFAFLPASVTVKPGGSVRWLNNDGTNHTVTSD